MKVQSSTFFTQVPCNSLKVNEHVSQTTLSKSCGRCSMNFAMVVDRDSLRRHEQSELGLGSPQRRELPKPAAKATTVNRNGASSTAPASERTRSRTP
jgi:hypothetical protein